jgi:hypothetical protein
MVQHPGHLDHALQLDLAPAPAHRGLAQRAGQVRRFVPQRGQVVLHQALDLGRELGIGGDTGLLDLPDLVVHFFQRFPERLDQLVDGLLARREVDFRSLLEFLQRDGGELDERPVVVPERVGRERLESVRELLLGVVEQRELLRGGLALFDRASGDLRELRIACAQLVVALRNRGFQTRHPGRDGLRRGAPLGYLAQLGHGANVLVFQRVQVCELVLHGVQCRPGDGAAHEPGDERHGEHGDSRDQELGAHGTSRWTRWISADSARISFM